MNIVSSEDDRKIKIFVSGSSEPAGIKKFADIADLICREKDKDMDIDLSEVEYMDSNCISILLKLYKFQKQKKRSFSIVKASYNVTTLLELCSLSDTLIS
jgi:anti-anti-sigma factor